MSPEARKITGVVLLALLAVPTGLCSMANTPTAIGSFWAQNELARGIGTLALIFSGIGYAICGLSIWGAIRLARAARHEDSAREPPP